MVETMKIRYCCSSRDNIKVGNWCHPAPDENHPANLCLFQMKLVLLLLTGLIGVSYQEGYYVWPMPYTGRDQLFYADGQSADNHKSNQLKVTHAAQATIHKNINFLWNFFVNF